MAKKKTNSKKSFSLNQIMSVVAIVLGVVALAMMFVTTVNVPATDLGVLGTVEYEGYTGLNVAFGYSENDVAILSFSFMALLPYVMVLAGIVLTALNTFGKKSSRLFDDIAGGLLLVAGVMFFMMPNFMVFADNIAAKVVAELDFKIVIGAIVAAVSSLVAGVAMFAKTFLKK